MRAPQSHAADGLQKIQAQKPRVKEAMIGDRLFDELLREPVGWIGYDRDIVHRDWSGEIVANDSMRPAVANYIGAVDNIPTRLQHGQDRAGGVQ